MDNTGKGKGKGRGRGQGQGQGQGQSQGKGQGKGKGRGRSRRRGNRPSADDGADKLTPSKKKERPLSEVTAPLVDIGINLTNRAFGRHWREVALRGAHAGVTALIVTGTSVPSSLGAMDLCAAADEEPCEAGSGRLPLIVHTVGVHPHSASSFEEGAFEAALKKGVARGRCVAVGECGLDFFRDLSPRPVQEHALRVQLRCAFRDSLPLFLHVRDAWRRFAEIWSEEVAAHEANRGGAGAWSPPRACVHCFTGTPEELAELIEGGFYVGLTGFITAAGRAGHIRDHLARLIPRGRLMIETDGPYMMPRNAPRAKTCEPMHLPYVLEEVAHLLSREPDDLAQEICATTSMFFDIKVPPRAELTQP